MKRLRIKTQLNPCCFSIYLKCAQFCSMYEHRYVCTNSDLILFTFLSKWTKLTLFKRRQDSAASETISSLNLKLSVRSLSWDLKTAPAKFQMFRNICRWAGKNYWVFSEPTTGDWISHIAEIWILSTTSIWCTVFILLSKNKGRPTLFSKPKCCLTLFHTPTNSTFDTHGTQKSQLRSLQMRVLWEIQRSLLESLGKGPECPILMMLNRLAQPQSKKLCGQSQGQTWMST